MLVFTYQCDVNGEINAYMCVYICYRKRQVTIGKNTVNKDVNHCLLCCWPQQTSTPIWILHNGLFFNHLSFLILQIINIDLTDVNNIRRMSPSSGKTKIWQALHCVHDGNCVNKNTFNWLIPSLNKKHKTKSNDVSPKRPFICQATIKENKIRMQKI